MTIDFVCLGVGKGATYVMKGKPSSSFVVRVDEKPILLIDCGAGIALSCLRNLNDVIPDKIYITHNHMDHTGDLPIVLGVLQDRNGTKPSVLGHPSVLRIVKKHRLHGVSAINESLEEKAHWIEPDENGVIHVQDNLTLYPFKSIHSYTCYGFLLRNDDKPILGYSADSDFDEDLYSKISGASVAVVDGRDVGNHDHASLDEIEAFATRFPSCQFWVLHYEETQNTFLIPNVNLLHEGDIVQVS